MTDAYFMGEALREAREALREGEVPVGCVIVRDGEIIARAHNERERTGDPTAHAEVLAIRRAAGERWQLDGCTLYVTLEPCPMCAGAIALSRVGQVVYGASDPTMGCAGSVYSIPEDPAFGHFCRCGGGVEEASCKALLEEFFRSKRARLKTEE